MVAHPRNRIQVCRAHRNRRHLDNAAPPHIDITLEHWNLEGYETCESVDQKSKNPRIQSSSNTELLRSMASCKEFWILFLIFGPLVFVVIASCVLANSWCVYTKVQSLYSRS